MSNRAFVAADLALIWRIELFGGPRACRGETVVSKFRSQKIGALLSYLALFPHRLHHREALAGLFWPDADPETGRTNLRTALASLRRELEPDDAAGRVIAAEGRHTIGLAPGSFATDVAGFEGKVASVRSVSGDARADALGDAIALYKAPLLPGNYEPWALAERDRLADVHLDTVGELIELHRAGGRIDSALSAARHAIAADPPGERGHLFLLRLLVESGQRAAAQRHFDEVSKLFKRTLDTEPSPELRAALNGEPAVRIPPAAAVVTTAVPMAPPVRLPSLRTPFFGREAERASLLALLSGENARLVSVTGPGGIGKTRIAIEAASDVRAQFTGGVFFVPLADIPADPSAADTVFERVLDALEATRTASDARSQTIAWLNERGQHGSVLLVLDNAEQIVESVARVVDTLLGAADRCCVLVTTRHVLAVDGEQELALSPLPIPRHRGQPERLLEFPSVVLFVHRAQRARADFVLGPHNVDAIAQLCVFLEGVPLAIELAAAWAHTLTPAQILARLTGGKDQRFDLLVSRKSGVPERHASLRATIAWSWGQLPAALRAFFARLSVFSGGWSLEAAEAVTGEPDTLGALTELRERSLIVAEEMGDSMRFSMLESLRAFAAETFAAEPDGRVVMESVAARHASHFLALAETAAKGLNGPEQAVWAGRLDADQGNHAAALAHFAAAGDHESAIRLVIALWRYWLHRGQLSEARRRVSETLAKAGDAPPAQRARLMGINGSLAGAQGDFGAAQEQLEASLSLLRQLGDHPGIAGALCGLGAIAKHQGRFDDAVAHLDEGLFLYRAVNNIQGMARALQNLGNVYADHGDYAAARALYDESLTMSEAMGDVARIGLAHHNIGAVASQMGDLDTARVHGERSLQLRRDVGDLVGIGFSLEMLGALARNRGDFEMARRHYDEALGVLRQSQALEGVLLVRLGQGELALMTGDKADAEVCLRDAVAQLRAESATRYGAYALELGAQLACDRDDFARSAGLFGAANTLRTTLSAPLNPHELAQLHDRLERLRQRMSADEFETARVDGARLAYPDALSLAIAEHHSSANPAVSERSL